MTGDMLIYKSHEVTPSDSMPMAPTAEIRLAAIIDLLGDSSGRFFYVSIPGCAHEFTARIETTDKFAGFILWYSRPDLQYAISSDGEVLGTRTYNQLSEVAGPIEMTPSALEVDGLLRVIKERGVREDEYSPRYGKHPFAIAA